VSVNLLLRGGPGHDFEATSALVDDVLGEAGVRTTMVDEPSRATMALRRGAVADEPVSTVTVNALRWSMAEPRYAHLRDRFAVSIAPSDLAAFDDFVRSGGGMLALHTAVICFDGDPAWKELCGASWDWATSSHPPAGRVTVRVTDAGRAHPVTAGLEGFVVEDELYGDLDHVDGLVPLLVGTQDGATHPVLWGRELGRGRVVTDLLGHGPASITHPAHRRLLARAAAWVAAADVPSDVGGRT
jgi:type 1 glutamine amidotransferase